MLRVFLAVLAERPGLEGEDPVGLGYLAALLRNHADITFAGFITGAPLLEQLEQERPDRLLLGTFNGLDDNVKNCMARAHELGIETVVGGPALALPQSCRDLVDHGIETAVFGEADALNPALLLGSLISQRVPGFWKRGQSLPKSPAVLIDPDSVPFPIRPVLEAGLTQTARMVASRGCPLLCDYCPQPVAAALTGCGWRPRGMSSINKELDQLCLLGAQDVSLTDECAIPLIDGRGRLSDITKAFYGRGLTFSLMLPPLAIAESGANEIDRWRSAGLRRTFLLLNAQSGLDGENIMPQVATINARLLAAGIDVDVGIITIDPFVTPLVFLNRLRQLAKLMPRNDESYVRSLSILPGTPIQKL